MSATIHPLPNIRLAMPCRRCGGQRRVTYDQLDEGQKARVGYGAIHACPDWKPRTFAEIYNDLDDDIVNVFRRRRARIIPLRFSEVGKS